MTGASIKGYSDIMSVAPGERIRFMVSCENLDRYHASLVRLINGDTNPAGPGFKEDEIETPLSGEYRGRYQAIHAGSHVMVSDIAERLNIRCALTLHAFAMPTMPGSGDQGIITRWDAGKSKGYALVLNASGQLALWLGDGRTGKIELHGDIALRAGVWYSIGAVYDPASGYALLHQEPIVNAVNSMTGTVCKLEPGSIVKRAVAGIDVTGGAAAVLAGHEVSKGPEGPIVGAHYNGKLERPRVYARALSEDEFAILAAGREPSDAGMAALWDFAHGIGPDGIPSDRVRDVSGNGVDGVCVNAPARAVTGRNWIGREENFVHAPTEYGAIHFHDDDLDDARWEPDLELTVPDGTRSNVYALRLRAAGGSDETEYYIPFFVRPPKGRVTAKIAFLAPTASYLAYANEHLVFEATVGQAILGHSAIVSAADLYLCAHPELGLSTYDHHSDGSGVCYSSRLRPIINMEPKYRHGATGTLWGFPADLHLIDWLNAKNYRYDVITDEDLHFEGADLLRSYRVVMTGTHPEYYSGAMLDALEAFTLGGGRMMYMGGNGFYWITSFHPEKHYLIEVRKAEGGSRAWQARPGEYHHSTTGERGGLWRNRARAPQKLAGVGFAAEGFDVSSYYRRMPDSFDPRAAFIFEGIAPDESIGGFGLVGGGAAGHELDRYDLELGTPPDALLLASSEGHSDNYQRVVEDVYFMHPGFGGTQDPFVRADLVYFVTAGGGAVFSTGSIAWCGSLAHENYDNNVSRITANVLTRFSSNDPLP